MAGRPGLLACLWAVNLLFALPAAFLVGEALRESIGASQVHEALRGGFDMGWYGEYRAEAEGIAASFRPTLSGPGGVLDNLEAWLDGRLFTRYPAVVALGLGYVLLWGFLTGGVLDRLARPADDHSVQRFLERGGRYLLRFVRLTLLSAGPYWLVYRFHRWGYDLVEELTRDVTAERTVLLWTVAVTAATAGLLGLVHVAFAYAKIATVVEERRSAFLAAVTGLGFVISHPLRTLGLYLAFGALSGALSVLWILVAPGAGQSTVAAIAVALVVGQLFLVLRLYVRLSLLAGQAALFRSIRG
jgi:hypothetical protein